MTETGTQPKTGDRRLLMAGFWSILLGGIAVLAGSGLALGAALGLTGLLLLQFSAGGSTFVAVDAVWNVLNSFTLSAIPIFIILGEIMLRSGISERVYAALSPVFQRVPGGLLHTNITVCTLFGAVSGSSLSTAAAVGSVAYPEMTRRGYDRKTVAGSLAAGGTLGLLIPPSLSLLIYGALTETSIGQLFLAGILPGIMFAAVFSVYILVRALSAPRIAPPPGGSDQLRPRCSQPPRTLALPAVDSGDHGLDYVRVRNANGGGGCRGPCHEFSSAGSGGR